MPTDKTGSVVILDLETTGLSITNCVILEVGILLCNDRLEPLHEFSAVVSDSTIKQHLDILEWKAAQRKVDFYNADYENAEYVWKMHSSSGLIDEIRNSPEQSYSTVQKRAIEFLRWHGSGQGKYPMTGSTVNFDRNFLEHHMPGLLGEFHYRNIDVSTIKGLVDKYRPDLKEERNKTIWQTAKKAHRVIADCHDTREELEFYVNNLFVDLKNGD